MHRDKKSEPQKSFQTQEPLASFCTHLLFERGQDFRPQKILKRFQWKLSMEIARFTIVVSHYKTSLGLGLVTRSNAQGGFFL